jgi:hypothetical protein
MTDPPSPIIAYAHRKSPWRIPLGFVACVAVLTALVVTAVRQGPKAYLAYLEYLDRQALRAWVESNPSFAHAETSVASLRSNSALWAFHVDKRASGNAIYSLWTPPQPPSGATAMHAQYGICGTSTTDFTESELAIGTIGSGSEARAVAAYLTPVERDGHRVALVNERAGWLSEGGRNCFASAAVELGTPTESLTVTLFQHERDDPTRVRFHAEVDGVWTRYDVVLRSDERLSIEQQANSP